MKIIIILILLIYPLNSYADVNTVEEWVRLYLRDCKTVGENHACKQSLEEDLGKMHSYSTMVFRYLDEHGLPRWLATVPIIESSYNDKAVSVKGALGLWQIMPYNIEKHKTKNRVIFGRRIKTVPTPEKVKSYGFNPVTSTKIAAKILRKLYIEYKDLEDTERTAMYAYNSGRRSVRLWRAGKRKLPEETINYYNKLMAVQHIIKNMHKVEVRPVKHRKILFLDYIRSFVKFDYSKKHGKIISINDLG